MELNYYLATVRHRFASVYEIKTDDFYSDIVDDIHSSFYTSEFQKDHILVGVMESYINKKGNGIFKDWYRSKSLWVWGKI